MHDLQSLEQRIAALEQRLAALEMGRDAQQHNAPAPAASEPATADALDALARRHCDRSLVDLLEVLNLKESAVLNLTFAQAKEKLFEFIVACTVPVLTYRAQTREARNGSLYLSLDFGFGTCAVFSADVIRVFSQTPYLMTSDWYQPDYTIDFDPPLVGVLERDRRGYPRVLRLTLPDADAWHTDVSIFNDAQEIEF
jgi:hypothetical protein